MNAESAKPTRDLAVQQLWSFCLVFEKQSYSAAARSLGASVPAVWEQVQGVEKRYRVRLFQRRKQRVYPTPAAALLYDSLRPLLAGLDSTYDLLHEHQGEFPRTLTLALGARMLLEDLGPAIRRFREQYPRVHLRLLDRDARTAANLVATDEADLGLGLESAPGILAPSVSTQRAYPIEYMAVFPKRHSLAAKPSLTLADLAAHPLIVGHRMTPARQLLDQALHRSGLLERVVVVAETDNSACTIACVQAGLGVGIVAGRASGLLCRTLATRSLHSLLGDAWIAFLWKRGVQLTVTVQTLMRLIRESIDEGGGKAKRR